MSCGDSGWRKMRREKPLQFYARRGVGAKATLVVEDRWRRSKRQLRWNRLTPRELEPVAGEWEVGRSCSEFQSFFTDLEWHNRFITGTAAVLGHVESAARPAPLVDLSEQEDCVGIG
jgi:hypothetical protein